MASLININTNLILEPFAGGLFRTDWKAIRVLRFLHPDIPGFILPSRYGRYGAAWQNSSKHPDNNNCSVDS